MIKRPTMGAVLLAVAAGSAIALPPLTKGTAYASSSGRPSSGATSPDVQQNRTTSTARANDRISYSDVIRGGRPEFEQLQNNARPDASVVNRKINWGSPTSGFNDPKVMVDLRLHLRSNRNAARWHVFMTDDVIALMEEAWQRVSVKRIIPRNQMREGRPQLVYFVPMEKTVGYVELRHENSGKFKKSFRPATNLVLIMDAKERNKLIWARPADDGDEFAPRGTRDAYRAKISRTDNQSNAVRPPDSQVTQIDWGVVRTHQGKTESLIREHVRRHEEPNKDEDTWSIFSGKPKIKFSVQPGSTEQTESRAVGLITEAWELAKNSGQRPVRSKSLTGTQHEDVYLVDMERIVGHKLVRNKAGGFDEYPLDHIIIVMQPGTSKIVTGFPSRGMLPKFVIENQIEF